MSADLWADQLNGLMSRDKAADIAAAPEVLANGTLLPDGYLPIH